MSTIRKHGHKWQAIVRISGHPNIAKSFNSITDAKRFVTVAEVKLRREDAGIAKIKFSKFEDVARRYYDVHTFKSINSLNKFLNFLTTQDDSFMN